MARILTAEDRTTMQIAFEVRDSLNRPIPEYGNVLDHQGLDDYTQQAAFTLSTLQKAGEWRASSVHYIAADGRDVGSASLN
jgi:hypothetical protein